MLAHLVCFLLIGLLALLGWQFRNGQSQRSFWWQYRITAGAMTVLGSLVFADTLLGMIRTFSILKDFYGTDIIEKLRDLNLETERLLTPSAPYTTSLEDFIAELASTGNVKDLTLAQLVLILAKASFCLLAVICYTLLIKE